jgi:beta-glucosidase
MPLRNQAGISLSTTCWKSARRSIALAFAAGILWGCGDTSSTKTKTETDAGLSVRTTLAMEAEVEAILESLSLEQKVSQMIQGEIAHVTPEDVRQYGLGSVLNGGGSFPQSNKHASVSDWLNLADAYWEASLINPAEVLGYRLFGEPMRYMATTMCLARRCFHITSD